MIPVTVYTLLTDPLISPKAENVFDLFHMEIFFLMLTPQGKKWSKRGSVFEILTTRFIAEIFFSNKTCGK